MSYYQKLSRKSPFALFSSPILQIWSKIPIEFFLHLVDLNSKSSTHFVWPGISNTRCHQAFDVHPGIQEDISSRAKPSDQSRSHELPPWHGQSLHGPKLPFNFMTALGSSVPTLQSSRCHQGQGLTARYTTIHLSCYTIPKMALGVLLVKVLLSFIDLLCVHVAEEFYLRK